MLEIIVLERQREHHVQEVRRVLQIGLRVIGRQPARLAIRIRRNRPHLRQQARGLDQEALPHLLRQQLGMKAARRVDHRREDGHRMRLNREAFKVVPHRFVQQLIVRQQVREPPQLRAVRQLAHDNQVRHLDERGFLRQFLDRDAPVTQDALLPINERDLALARAGIPVAIV
jgi:hypothetical protein